jgi:hypothetical protein
MLAGPHHPQLGRSLMGSRASQRQSKWVRVDRRYNQPFRLTGYTWRVIFKWGALLIVWAALLSSGSPFLDIIATAALIAYAVVRIRRYQRPSQVPRQGQAVIGMGMPAIPAAGPVMRFNPHHQDGRLPQPDGRPPLAGSLIHPGPRPLQAGPCGCRTSRRSENATPEASRRTSRSR